jgi:hypothetical protein
MEKVENFLAGALYRPVAALSSGARQLNGSMVLPFLNVVPDKLLRYEGGLFPGKINIQQRYIVTNGEPLSALAADNGFHRVSAGSSFRCSP